MIESRYGHLARVKERTETIRFSVENAPKEVQEEVRTRVAALDGDGTVT